jgi:P-type conjugative transfer protein TrbJ
MTRKFAALLLASTIMLTALPARAQFGSGIVFDPTNYSQNLLTATRALQEVNNQIQSLQNEATMITNMGRNLTSLPTSVLSSLQSDLSGITNLMNQAQGIAFNVDATLNAFNSSYPQSYASGTSASGLAQTAQQRWQDAMSAFQQTLKVQAQVVQNVQSDSATLSTLVTASQGAVGNLQAVQATNQLLALSTKQQLQIQNLMAAQYRATSLDQARTAQDEAAAQAEYSTFIGNGQNYTPN